jgi:hypothetical protein
VRELKALRKEAFSRAFDTLYEGCKRCAGTILSDGINKYFFTVFVFLGPQFGNLIVTLCIAHNAAYFKTIFRIECSPGANYSHKYNQ